MHGAIPPSIMAEAILIMAWRCLVFLTPILSVAAVWWLINQTDRIIHYLLPDLEWEHSLGWLNIKAERRAAAALRWIGYGIHALLAAALLGIVWATKGLQQFDAWLDPWAIGEVMLRVAVLAVCLGAWVLYLGGWLMPKLRAQREEAGLKKFRAKTRAIDKERNEAAPRSRSYVPLPRTRTNEPKAVPLLPVRLPSDRDQGRRRL